MKKYLEYLPISGVLVSFIGYYGVYSFYDTLGIDIYPYLDISEILLAFLTDISSMFYAICITTLIITMFAFDPYAEFTNGASSLYNSSETERKERVKKAFPETATGTLVFSLFMLLQIFNRSLEPSKPVDYAIESTLFLKYYVPWSFVWVIAIGCVLLIAIYLIGNYWRSGTKFQIFFICTFLAFIIHIYGSSKAIQANQLLTHPSKRVRSFSYHNKLIKTSQSYVYVGETNNYLFIVKKIDERLRHKIVSVFKKSEIDNLSFDSHVYIHHEMGVDTIIATK